ncbi:diguanylate cyclase [Pseudarthrobacter sp. NPDC058196]|uniref:diguanylate cyclase n=1 Tax=Pseudarthrobacter sp. NPDC058196 TaxID=3346376 RepID=UPI0036DC1E79
MLEKALHAVKTLSITHSGDPTGHLTLSAGISAFTDYHAEADNVLREADAALYIAKATGRNRVATAP